jgi:DNA end-binding protein Ku
MSRVIWKGAISFSLIHIPVNLQTASRSRALDLDMLDRRDFAPIGYQRINKSTGKAVEWDDIVKAYKHADDEYVVLTDEDFRLANVEATQTIDIQGFVRHGDISPEYFDTPYHLLPETRGEKVYGLLHDALTQSKTMAIGLVVIRTRQYVSAVFPHGPTLLLNTLRYEDEIIEPDVPPRRSSRASGSKEKTSVSAKEGAMAMKLIEEMRQPWDAAAFHDSYREDLLKRVEQKVKAGQTKTLTEPGEKTHAPRGSNIVDLTSLLRRSLETRRTSVTRTARSASARQTPARRIRRRAS